MGENEAQAEEPLPHADIGSAKSAFWASGNGFGSASGVPIVTGNVMR